LATGLPGRTEKRFSFEETPRNFSVSFWLKRRGFKINPYLLLISLFVGERKASFLTLYVYIEPGGSPVGSGGIMKTVFSLF
jgi:hypothetical protein